MYQSTTLIGNLGQKPETKILDNGSQVTKMSLATSRTWKDKNGDKQEDTQWHNIVLWGKLAELADKYLDKGSKVMIVGRLDYRKADYDGQTRYYTDIVANEMKFLDGKPREAAAPAPTPLVAQRYPTVAEKDLPF